MRKIHLVLPLHFEAGLSIRAIARSVQASPATVGDYIRRAQGAGLAWMDYYSSVEGIPVHADHRFRCKPITHSSASRSLIPVEPDHSFRRQADHFLALTGIVH